MGFPNTCRLVSDRRQRALLVHSRVTALVLHVRDSASAPPPVHTALFLPYTFLSVEDDDDSEGLIAALRNSATSVKSAL